MSICKEQLEKGICLTPNCRKNHTFQFCEPCGVICATPNTYTTHVNGRFHRRQIKDTKLECLAFRRCIICGRDIPCDSWTSHIGGRAHDRQQRFTKIKAAVEQSESDKCGIKIVERVFDFSLVDISQIGKLQSKELRIDNFGSDLDINLLGVRMTSSLNRRNSSSFSIDAGSDIIVKRGLPIHVILKFLPTHRGQSEDRVEFIFRDNRTNTKFAITRKSKSNVDNAFEYELIKPIAPYTKKERTLIPQVEQFIPGIKPASFSAISWKNVLPQCYMPREFRSMLRELKNDERGVESLKNFHMPKDFTFDTYSQFFELLLWTEEAISERDLLSYEMKDQTLEPTPGGKLYLLTVVGLAEKRPSVILSDRILVRPSAYTHGPKWFEGYVHEVHQKEIGLAFNPQFHQFRGQRYDVRFKLGRLPLRRMHQGLSMIRIKENHNRILFPGRSHAIHLRLPNEQDRRALRFYNRKIAENPAQLMAVAAVVNLPKGSPPFVIFGPPGTGKTVTMVESILQLLQSDPLVKILVCAPSNSASDLIAERLNTLSILEMFRMNSPSRQIGSLPSSLMKFSSKNSKDIFSVPALPLLMKYRVIVSTLISGAIPYGIGFPRGHFSHVFVDEAGQAVEPEFMIPVMTLADQFTNVILSGDPKQLGPIVRSFVADKLGLGASYLDRLMKEALYNPKTGGGLTVAKLTRNWRSHPSILKFPNDTFYNGELQACGDPVVINSYLNSDVLARKGFPIVFQAILGVDEREASSPSFFNRGEATYVKTYVQQLMSDRRVRISNQDIGVISPYNAQCQKIRVLLKPVAPGVKVGSVEEFQGQERRVIIISTVRSSLEFLEYDIRYSLGFVANPRRFNVAITRAQALLLVIGDPEVLGQDPLWRSFLNYIYLEGGWKGPKMSWDPKEKPETIRHDLNRQQEAEDEVMDLIDRVSGLSIAEVGGDDGGNVDKPWREDE